MCNAFGSGELFDDRHGGAKLARYAARRRAATQDRPRPLQDSCAERFLFEGLTVKCATSETIRVLVNYAGCIDTDGAICILRQTNARE